MKHRVGSAHILALIAIILALGGNALAFTLGKNSVGSKQLKKNAVTTAKVKNEAITGGKVKKGTLTGTQINASTLGTVPAANSAQTAQTAQTANGLSAAEPWHEVGAPGEPGFEQSWKSDDATTAAQSVAFYKDHEGIVHLRGSAIDGVNPKVFTLPPGFRPTAGKVADFSVRCGGSSGECLGNQTGLLSIWGSGIGNNDGRVEAPSFATSILLTGITFRAES